jgi:signal transduction histidine kinase
LGLAVAKKIVEHHGGKINLTSKLEEGTQFELKFKASA